MAQIVSPEDLEQFTEEDEEVLEEVVAQINRKLRRHWRPGAPCYIRLDPWPHDRIVNTVLAQARDRWNAEVEVSYRFSPFVLRFERPRPAGEAKSDHRHERVPQAV